MSFTTSALILSWVAIVLLALVVARLVQQVHELQQGSARRPERVGMPPGAPAPGLSRLDVPRGSTAVLLFLSGGCRTCREVLDEALTWKSREASADVEIRVLYAEDAPAGSVELGGVTVSAYGGQRALFEQYDALATPFAAVVDDGRVVRSEPLGSREAAVRLLASLGRHEVGSIR